MAKTALVWVFGFGLLFFGLRDLAGWASLGKDFTPFSSGNSVSGVVWEESSRYAPPVAALATRGQLFADDLKEHAGRTLPQPILHAVVLAPFVRIFGAELTWSVARAFFPALSLTFFFWLFSSAFVSFPSRFLAALAAVTFPFAPRNTLLLGEFAFLQPLEATRFSNPGLSYCLLAGFLLLLKRFLERGTRRVGAAAGVALGLMSYASDYYAVALAVGFGFFWVLLAVRKEPIWLRRLSQVLAVSAVIALPQAVLLAKAQGLVTPQVIPRAVGFFAQISFTGLFLMLAAFGLAKVHFKNSGKLTYPLFFLLVLGGAGFGLILQRLTGYSAAHEPYWNQLIQPVAFALFLYLGGQFANLVALPFPPKVMKGATVGVALLLVGTSGYRQVASFTATADDHDRRANHYRALEWIRDNTPVDTVVGTSDRTATALLTAVTGRWSFVPFVQRTSASLGENLGRYYAIAKLEGKSWKDVQSTWNFSQSEGLLSSAEKIWNGFDAEPFLAARQLNYVLTQTPTPGKRVFESGSWKVMEIQYVAAADVATAPKKVSP